MIIEGIMNVLKVVILFIIGLFPKLPDMSTLSQSVNSVTAVFSAVDSFISVSLLGFCFGVLFIFTHIDFIWSIIMWVIRKIPGVS